MAGTRPIIKHRLKAPLRRIVTSRPVEVVDVYNVRKKTFVKQNPIDVEVVNLKSRANRPVRRRTVLVD
ncbi:MAG: hypothetical protein NT067_04325 [Candidatus Diapherotrites archaeon]|nr:hypothetical protein [Candidatus Diapherotrites archaeon]